MATQLTLASFLYFLMFCATMTFSPGPMTLLLMGFGMQEGLKRSMPVQLGASPLLFHWRQARYSK